MSTSSAQLTSLIQIPDSQIPLFRARSKEPDFADRLFADLASASVLDDLERQQILGKVAITMTVVRTGTPGELSSGFTSASSYLPHNRCSGEVVEKSGLNHPPDDHTTTQLNDIGHPNNPDPSMQSTTEVCQPTESIESVSNSRMTQASVHNPLDMTNQDSQAQLQTPGSADSATPGYVDEGEISRSEEICAGGADKISRENPVSPGEAPASTPSNDKRISYPTPESSLPYASVPANKHAWPTENPFGGKSLASGLDAHTDATTNGYLDPKSLMTEDDSFDDMEMNSIRDMMSEILEKANPPDVNSRIAAMSTEPAPRHTTGHPAYSTPIGDQPHRPSVLSGSVDLANNLSVSPDEEFFDVDHDNTRKRKRSPVGLEHDHRPPSRTRHSSESPSDARAEHSVFDISRDEEDASHLDSQSQLSQYSSRLTTPSSSLRDPDEVTSEDESHIPDEVDLAFSKLTPQKIAEARRASDQLLLRGFDIFLEHHSRTWRASGFWSAPSWKASESSNHILHPNRAGLMTYLVSLHNEGDVHDVKLRIARVSLFLFFEREVKSQRERGIAETSLKRNAVSSLCNSNGLGAVEKRRRHKAFNNEKKIGEYWWWCACYFGPSFLLRCSKEAGKKINQSRFPLDAMIASVLHDNPPRVKPYPALDAAVVHLLVRGEFPQIFLRQEIRRWEKSRYADTDTAFSRVWRPFSVEEVSKEALISLEKWRSIPNNILLAF